MPHKHKRKADNDESNFSLPPTSFAASLPTNKIKTTPAPRSKKRKTAHIENYGADDTPKAFARLMAFKNGATQRSGLDDGVKKKPKKNKAAQQQKDVAEAAEQGNMVDSEAQQAPPKSELKILPGESLSEFRQRVAQALPLTGIAKSTKKIAGAGDHRVTKHERHLKRLQEGWRKEEARIRDKELEERELAEEEEDEMNDLWEDKTAAIASGSSAKGKKGKKKTKRKMVAGEVDDGRADEWEELRNTREERKGLHDVVQAPPSFDRIPREIFKVKNGARVEVGNVPNSVGSLRKREELGQERLGIIETYRKLMAAKRGEQ